MKGTVVGGEVLEKSLQAKVRVPHIFAAGFRSTEKCFYLFFWLQWVLVVALVSLLAACGI